MFRGVGGHFLQPQNNRSAHSIFQTTLHELLLHPMNG